MRTIILAIMLVYLSLYSSHAWGAATERGVTIEYFEPSSSVCEAGIEIVSVSSGLVITQVNAKAEQQSSETGNKAKRFEMVALAGGGFNLKSELNDLCLTVPNANTDRGIDLTFETCGAGTHQQFEIGASPTLIKPMHNLTQCLDVAGNVTTAGAAIQQWDCHGGTNQDWTYKDTAAACVLDDLALTRIYRDVVTDGDPGVEIDVPATAKTGGGKISQAMCVPIKDDQTAVGIHFKVSAIDESGNESVKTPEIIWPVAGTRNCDPPDTTPPAIPTGLEIINCTLPGCQ